MKKIKIYTDGACSGNPGPGGWCFISIDESGSEGKSSGGCSATTNNKMELLATIKALKSLEDQNCQVEIYTDSTYVKNGITAWIKNWKKNNWITSSKTAVKNKELWIELDNLCSIYQVDWVWVKAHNGDHYNELVDKTARAECKKYM